MKLILIGFLWLTKFQNSIEENYSSNQLHESSFVYETTVSNKTELLLECFFFVRAL